MKSIDLNLQWKLHFYRQGDVAVNNPHGLINEKITVINATVPGNVELDLIKAEMMRENIYKGSNILETEKFETHEWWYETDLVAPTECEGKKVFLIFEGVDCLAEYWLNGELIGKSENMLIPKKLDVSGKLKINESNKLFVKISPTVPLAEKEAANANLLATKWKMSSESMYFRKAPHMYGWDIMPRAVSAGIWRDVKLCVEEPYEIKEISVATRRLENDAAVLRFVYEITAEDSFDDNEIDLEVQGKCGASTFYSKQRVFYKKGSFNISIEKPLLWWPYGYGDANLYETTIVVFKGDEVVAKKNLKTGIRTVKLINTDNTEGTENDFRIFINNVDIFCKGTNWTPLDAFHSRDNERMDKALMHLSDIGCNIVRCWGGNIYEPQKFYDYCDEKGIMIWQDFAMACNPYPQTQKFKDLMKEEAEFVIKEYRNHAALILWSGDNECDMMFYDAGTDPNENIITREVLKEAVLFYDPVRPYIPSSPYVSANLFKISGFDKIPENHLWGKRPYFKSSYYTESKAHFISEIGYHGCNIVDSLKKYIDEDKLWPYGENNQWVLHSSDQQGKRGLVKIVEDQLKFMFGEKPDNLEDFSLASQICQAEAKKFFIENMRMGRPVKSGIIWWNLLDGWPQISPAVVDYYFERKLAYNYIKRSQAPFCIMLQEESSWNLAVYAGNDTLNAYRGECEIVDSDTGECLFKQEFKILENRTEKIGNIPYISSQKRMLVIRWSGDMDYGINHYVCGYPTYPLDLYKKWLRERTWLLG